MWCISCSPKIPWNRDGIINKWRVPKLRRKSANGMSTLFPLVIKQVFQLCQHLGSLLCFFLFPKMFLVCYYPPWTVNTTEWTYKCLIKGLFSYLQEDRISPLCQGFTPEVDISLPSARISLRCLQSECYWDNLSSSILDFYSFFPNNVVSF